MPISVTCPSCHARFQVSEKFAGKKGPCPKCKGVISIPKLEQQVKIDDRAHGGTKDASGQLVLKPIERVETKIKPLVLAGMILGVIAAFGVAWLVGSFFENKADIPWFILVAGAFAIGPPVAAAGYSFLRDDELEAHSGLALWTRALLCSVGYVVLWVVYYLVVPIEYRALGSEPIMGGVAIAPFIVVGAIIALACFDLGFGSALMHYVMYLIAAIALCLTLGWPMIAEPDSQTPKETPTTRVRPL